MTCLWQSVHAEWYCLCSKTGVHRAGIEWYCVVNRYVCDTSVIAYISSIDFQWEYACRTWFWIRKGISRYKWDLLRAACFWHQWYQAWRCTGGMPVAGVAVRFPAAPSSRCSKAVLLSGKIPQRQHFLRFGADVGGGREDEIASRALAPHMQPFCNVQHIVKMYLAHYQRYAF